MIDKLMLEYLVSENVVDELLKSPDSFSFNRRQSKAPSDGLVLPTLYGMHNVGS